MITGFYGADSPFPCPLTPGAHRLNGRGDSDMNACNLTVAVTALANTIACGLNAEEINLLSSVLVQLGDTLATIAAHRALCEAREKE